LGGSFTGNLAVDPAHLGDLRRSAAAASGTADQLGDGVRPGSDRSRRIRDAVEASLSDVILLGTEEQVRLAAAVAEPALAEDSAMMRRVSITIRHRA
jgi:hypothetical protein